MSPFEREKGHNTKEHHENNKLSPPEVIKQGDPEFKTKNKRAKSAAWKLLRPSKANIRSTKRIQRRNNKKAMAFNLSRKLKNHQKKQKKSKMDSRLLGSRIISLESEEIDYKATMAIFRRNGYFENFYLDEIREKNHNNLSCLMDIYLFLTRMGVYELLIVTLQYFPSLLLLMLFTGELAYLVNSIGVYCKFRHLRHGSLMLFRVLEAIFLLGFFVILFWLSLKNETKVKAVPVILQYAGILFRKAAIFAGLGFAALRIILSTYWRCKNKKQQERRHRAYVGL